MRNKTRHIAIILTGFIFCCSFIYGQENSPRFMDVANDTIEVLDENKEESKSSRNKQLRFKDKSKEGRFDSDLWSDKMNAAQLVQTYQAQPKSSRNFGLLVEAYDQNKNSVPQFETLKAFEALELDKQKKELCAKFNSSIPFGLKEYHRNLLKSIDKNGILITNGKLDTYPLWILQELEGYRNDVIVLNYDLLIDDAYRSGIRKKHGLQLKNSYYSPIDILSDLGLNNLSKDIHFALSMNSEFIKKSKEYLYATGLTFKYSPTPIDNITLIEDNWTSNFDINYLKTGNVQDKPTKKFHSNYLMSLILLSNHHKETGNIKEHIKLINKIKQVAKICGKSAVIEPYIRNEKKFELQKKNSATPSSE